MSGLLLNLALICAVATAVPARANHAPQAVDDHTILLLQPAPVVEVPVLANDTDADGDPLRVVSLSVSHGGRAEIVDRATVRVYLDWSQVSGGGLEYLVAGGTYLVSDGVALRQARWSVWYWPVMQP
ncbi:MAG: Ig-like domain-containing protein [Caldilineales bacterium]